MYCSVGFFQCLVPPCLSLFCSLILNMATFVVSLQFQRLFQEMYMELGISVFKYIYISRALISFLRVS